MVRTSTGPAEKSKPEVATKTAADEHKSVKPSDIDDATWDQIESMARSQRTTTGEVIKRAVINQYGNAPATGAYHSGSETDPSLA